MINVQRYIVASAADHALTSMSVRLRCPDMRAVLEQSDIFTDESTAHARVQELHDTEDTCEVDKDKCDRCHDYNPQVWNVTISITPAAQ